MPNDRASGHQSSQENKSDIEQNQPQQHQQPQQQHQQSQKKQQQPKPQRKLSQIQNQIEESQSPQNQSKDIQLPKAQLQTQTPNRYSLYRETFNFNWNMKQFDINKAVQQFGKLDQHPELQDTDQEDFLKQINQLKDDTIKLRVYKSNKQTTGLTKKTTYFVTGRDKTGPFEISRYYHEFVLLREKLLLRWPGCFIPPIPTKKFGNNPYELVLIRMRYLNNFLKGLSKTPQIYYGQQCQIFFKHQGDYINTNGKLIEQELQKLKAYQNQQLLEKYKQVYGNMAEELSEQEQSIAISQIKGLQEELKSWKVDMSRFKQELRFLITSKDKYYQAMTRLSTVLLPQFQSVILDWINDDKFSKQSLQNETEKNSGKQGYLLNTEQYGNTLKDAALSVRNYNQSLWFIYDIFKFELKQTDAILQAIQSYEFLLRQMEYLNRNININKDQLQSLDQKKTTLKIFMMGGTVQEKRTRINKESQTFQQKLTIVKELLNLVLNVLITSIDNFHNHRAETYKRLLAKSSHEELVLVKKLMDFHIFELQTFRKKDFFSPQIESRGQQQEEIIEQDTQ